MELITLLERMKMEHLLAQLDGVCEQAAKGDLDYKGFLAQALETEWRGRHQRGVESRLRLARFPWIKTLEQFDFDFQPSIDRKAMRELGGLSFVERAENVVLLGPPGVGKTHLAVALGVKAVEAGYSVLFLTLEGLMGRLVRARHENRLERTLQQLVYPRSDLGRVACARSARRHCWAVQITRPLFSNCCRGFQVGCRIARTCTRHRSRPSIALGWGHVLQPHHQHDGPQPAAPRRHTSHRCNLCSPFQLTFTNRIPCLHKLFNTAAHIK